MSDLPDKVKVGWRDYRIENWAIHKAAAARRYGETNHTEGVIRVDVSHGREQAAETLLHEILHAVYQVWWRPERCAEEPTVQITAQGLMTVWRDNPEVFSWIDEQITGAS